MIDASAIDTIVFDLYSTLLDVGSIAQAAAALTPDPAALVTLWRQKQLEYTWLREAMDRYVDFWQVTAEALTYAAARLGLALTGEQHARLCEAWNDLRPYAEVTAALDALAGWPLAVLSNGSPAMLAHGVASAGLGGRFAAVLSVDAVQAFKPNPVVYRLATDQLGATPARVLFVSANAWDAAGGKAFGLTACWINRAGLPMEELGHPPDAEVADLTDLARLLTAAPTGSV